MLEAIVLLLVFVNLALAHQGNFIYIDNKKDGEFEKRVRYNEMTVKETSVQNHVTHKKLSRVHEMTDGEHFIQLIYSGSQLVDCDYVRDRTTIEDFLTTFSDKVKVLESLVEQAPWISDENMVNVTYQSLEEPTEDVQYLLTPFRKLKKHCRKMQKNKMHMMKQNNTEIGKTRSKRAIRNKLMFPDTNYCGPHNVAPSAGSLAGYVQADWCCKKHDQCPYSVPSFTKKYNIVNIRPTTMSHCHCDDRFYTCLRMTNTDASNMVGNIFFNIIKTKCFTLKKENVCSKRSWWGKCLKYEYKKQATVRDPIPYPT